MQTILVTALYDIGRATSVDGRKFEDYLNWFRDTLRLRSPMIIFGEESLRGFVIKHRPLSYPTRFIAMPLSVVHYAQYVDAISVILNKKAKEKQTDVGDRMPLYNVINFAKFEWLRMATEEKWSSVDVSKIASKSGLSSTSLTGSPSVWLWVDAGISRFFDPSFPFSRIWPHRSWSQKIATSDQIWIQSSKFLSEGNPVASLALDGTAFIGSHDCRLVATIFGGNIQAIRWLTNAGRRLFEKDMLYKNQVDNEQVGLGLLARRDPGHFCIVARAQDFVSFSRSVWRVCMGTRHLDWIPWANWLSYGMGMQRTGDLYEFLPSAAIASPETKLIEQRAPTSDEKKDEK